MSKYGCNRGSRRGKGEGSHYGTEPERRLVYFIYFIVESKICLLSVRVRVGCPYKYNSGWSPRWFKLFRCKISITLRLLSELHKKYIEIKNGEYLQYLDYTHKYLRECQRNYVVFCGFLADLNSPSDGIGIGVLVGHQHQVCFSS